MPIFPRFSRLFDAIEELGRSLDRIAQTQEEMGPALDRLAALEMSRHQFEAQMEGLYLKAEGKLKAASNAEARERQLKKSYENRLDSFDPDGETGAEPQAVLSDDAPPSETERLRALPLGMAPNNKAAAVRAKFGI